MMMDVASISWRTVELEIECPSSDQVQSTLDGVQGCPAKVDPQLLMRAPSFLALPQLASSARLADRLLLYSNVVDAVQHGLGNALLADRSVRDHFEALIPDGDHEGLRLMLRASDDLAAAQPWEYARFDGGRPIALLDRVGILRAVEPLAAQPLKRLGSDLRVLLVTSCDPPDYPRIELGDMARALRESLEPFGDGLEFFHLDDPDPHGLAVHLARHDPDWVVFVGHGESGGSTNGSASIVLRQGDRPTRIGAAELAGSMHSVELCLLLACHSGQPAPGGEAMTEHLARAGVGFAIGMNGPIERTLAAQFAAGLLGRLAAGDSLDQAVQVGRTFIQLHATLPQWGHPVVHCSPTAQLRVPEPVDSSGDAWRRIVSIVGGDVSDSVVVGTSDDDPVQIRLQQIRDSLVVGTTGGGGVEANLGSISRSVIVGSGSEESVARLISRFKPPRNPLDAAAPEPD